MKRLHSELTDLMNRSVDRHVRLAVTGLSRSGKTAFITSLVNQLLNVNAGARLPLFSAARDKRLLGVKRIPHRDLSVPRFAYDEGIASLYGEPRNGQHQQGESVKYALNYITAQKTLFCVILLITHHYI